jgi:hypothetical protein
MKKIFCAAILATAVFTLSAQQPVVYTTTSTSTVDYTNQVPVVIRTNFQMANPTISEVRWMPISTEWWSASYNTDNNRMTRVYYNTQPWYMEPGRDNSFKVALPVLNTYVPEDVVASAIRTYGGDLFSITARKKDANGMQSYFVTLIKNGVSEIQEMSSDATAMK